MPIFEYSCRACHHRFETLVRGTKTPVCPQCQSEDLEKLFSLPAVKSGSTQSVIRRETTRRDATQARDRVNDQRNYELHHDD